jgi:serine/threonine-protein kinase
MEDREDQANSDTTREIKIPTEGMTLAHYTILSKIGGGAMGEVYLAFDANLERKVALKLLPPSTRSDATTRARFLREARTAAALTNPNIVTIYEVGEYQSTPYIAMEYVDGKTLRDLMSVRRLPVVRVRDLFLQICEGVAAAHQMNIIHRDLKPANILVNNHGRVKILDFGLAKFRDATDLSSAGKIMGTVDYMSPEQAQGKELDNRSDIFSMGVILYEMLTGTLPFVREDITTLMFAIIHQDYTSMSDIVEDIPLEFNRVVQKCLEKDPQRRYQEISAMVDDLKEYSVRIAATGVAQTTFPAKKLTIAVLPFENLGPSEQEYLADGITDEINTQLAHMQELRVISYSSSRHYRQSEMRPREIGHELGVDYLLLGNLRWDVTGALPRVRINCKLLRVTDETLVWAENYDRVLNEILVLQSEIGEKVIEALGGSLLTRETAATKVRDYVIVEAYDLYLQGNEFFPRSYSDSDLRKALSKYEEAVKIDPHFAAAHARLSQANSTIYWFYHDRSPERVNKAREAAERSLELDPQMADGIAALGFYYYYCLNEYELALEQFSLARKSKPNDSRLLLATGFIMRRLGKWDEASQHILFDAAL